MLMTLGNVCVLGSIMNVGKHIHPHKMLKFFNKQRATKKFFVRKRIQEQNFYGKLPTALKQNSVSLSLLSKNFSVWGIFVVVTPLYNNFDCTLSIIQIFF